MKKIKTILVCAASLVAMVGVSSTAKAQCVKNDAGFAATVQWYNTGDVTYTKDTAGKLVVDLANANVRPLQQNKGLLIGQSICGPSGSVVVITVEGGVFATVGIVAAVAAAAGIACVVTAGVACVAEAEAGGPAVTLAMVSATAGTGATLGGIATKLIPSPKGLFFAGPLPTGDDVTLRGTVFNANGTFTNHATNVAKDTVCHKTNQGAACYRLGKPGVCGMLDSITAECKIGS